MGRTCDRGKGLHCQNSSGGFQRIPDRKRSFKDRGPLAGHVQGRVLQGRPGGDERHIDEEIAHARQNEKAYIGLKMNSLTDKKIIDKLIEASQAGVKIDMVVRGICCLAAGIPGYTENIEIRSIVGRYLEHSRIYIFGIEERRKIYIASADFMTRNTVKRVEVAIPIESEELKVRIEEMFITMLSDNKKARKMKPNGLYEKLPIDGTEVNAQELLFEQSYLQPHLQ